jgi:hypothetical protein
MKKLPQPDFPASGIHQVDNTIILWVYYDKESLSAGRSNHKKNGFFSKATLIDCNGICYRVSAVEIQPENFWQKLLGASRMGLQLEEEPTVLTLHDFKEKLLKLLQSEDVFRRSTISPEKVEEKVKAANSFQETMKAFNREGITHR